MSGRPDPDYVAARSVLLDALEALGPHRDAVVLVGAQALYLHVGEADLAVAPYTTDSDLMVDPTRLGDRPLLADILEAAGFLPSSQPGAWIGAGRVVVDLMVPEALSGRGRRGADLGAHGRKVARWARGLEPSLVDRKVHSVAALDEADDRRFEIEVAGPAAILVAKLHKLADRRGTSRSRDKDALDVLRLLRGTPTDELARRFVDLAAQPLAGTVTREATVHLRSMFGKRHAEGARMAVRATMALEDPATIALSCEALASALLGCL